MTEARIICDSISPANHRLTTFLLTLPKFCVAEFNTHRTISRNSASSRAIPTKRIMDAVTKNPVLPAFWGKNQAGMQANQELDDTPSIRVDEPLGVEFRSPRDLAREQWLRARDLAVQSVESLTALGLHKQIVNRIIEPWMHTTILATATDWENLFALRAHNDAQPEFRELAYKMLEVYNAHVPTPKEEGEWHIPFGDQMPDDLTHEQRLKVAVARAARLSYLTFEGEMNVEKDYELHDRLLASGHLSPFEHVACVPPSWFSGPTGNFRGWIQYRKTIQGENKSDPRVRKWTFEEARAAKS